MSDVNYPAEIGERLTAIEVTTRSIEAQLVAFDARVTPLLLSQSGIQGRLERAESDLGRAFDKVRETETWKAQIERRLGKNDFALNTHVQSSTLTMAAIRADLEDQSRVNAAFFAHRDEWARWKNRLLGGVLVVQTLAGIAFVFKDQIWRALFGN